MARPSKYPRELRERAVRAVAESMEQRQYPSEFEAIRTIAGKLGIGSPETLREVPPVPRTLGLGVSPDGLTL